MVGRSGEPMDTFQQCGIDNDTLCHVDQVINYYYKQLPVAIKPVLLWWSQ